MQSIWKSTAMAIAEAAIRVKYVTDKFAFASFKATSTSGTLVIQLGVSDTSLAAAVSAGETVYTSASTAEVMKDIVETIGAWKTATSGAEVESGDFKCEIQHALLNSTVDTPHHGSVDKFEDDAGTTNNLANEWREVLLWDNDAIGVYGVHRRIPNASSSKGGCVIDSIVGDITETDGTIVNAGGMRRIIYDDEGNALWNSGAQTTLGNANFNIIAGDRGAPRAYQGPVIVFDRAATAGDYANVGATDATIIHDIVRMPL